jgi:sugar/nucleoside kinase (ribokinase family)
LVVKRGEYGAMLFEGSRLFFVPAYPLEDEVDPTGAGDSFAGALLGSLAQSGDFSGRGLRKALMTAFIVASFCVEGVGYQRLREVSIKDVDARLSELRELISVSG